MSNTDNYVLASKERNLLLIRLLIGLMQGIALSLFFETHFHYLLPRALYIFLLMQFLLLPPLLISALGHMRLLALRNWIIIFFMITAASSYYEAWRTQPLTLGITNFSDVLQRLGILLEVGFFIAQTLVLAGSYDKRYIARYSTYFTYFWRLVIQFFLSLFFAGIVVVLLITAAELFNFIHLAFIANFIEELWVLLPVITLSAALAWHITDTHKEVVCHIRTLLLGLFAWCLPVTTLLVSSFLLALLFVSNKPAWQADDGILYLFIMGSCLILFINAVYQEGEDKNKRKFLRLVCVLAILLLIPLVSLAAYALTIRVHQYGWTIDRVEAAAYLLLMAGYTITYTATVLTSGIRLEEIKNGNLIMAISTLGILFALLSPLADPARIAVNSQVKRLTSGVTAKEQFNFDYFKYEGLRFGNEALEKLSDPHQEHDHYISKQAELSLQKIMLY